MRNSKYHILVNHCNICVHVDCLEPIQDKTAVSVSLANSMYVYRNVKDIYAIFVCCVSTLPSGCKFCVFANNIIHLRPCGTVNSFELVALLVFKI